MKRSIGLVSVGLILLMAGVAIGSKVITIDRARVHKFQMTLNPRTGDWVTCTIGLIAVDADTNELSQVYRKVLAFRRDGEGEGATPAGILNRLDGLASDLQTYAANKYED